MTAFGAIGLGGAMSRGMRARPEAARVLMAHDIVDRIRDDTRRWLAAGSVHPADAQTSEIIRRLQDRRGPGVVARSFPTIATFGD